MKYSIIEYITQLSNIPPHKIAVSRIIKLHPLLGACKIVIYNKKENNELYSRYHCGLQ